MYDFTHKDQNIPGYDHFGDKNTKIGFTELTIDIQKILNDAKEFLKGEGHRNCFGQVTFENNRISFYSEKDVNKLQVLGSVNLEETLNMVEQKIPIIDVNNDTLEIEQEL